MKEKKLKSDGLSRAFKLGKTVAKVGFNLAKDRIQNPKGEKLSVSPSQIKAAKEMIQTMGEMKGGLMKIGQMLSISGDLVLPKEITQLFTSLQKSSSYMPEEDLIKCFEREFGKLPEEVFTSFDRKPIAAASIGQVHIAELASGKKVAVKVQYPKIVSAIKSDLNQVDRIEKLFDIFGIPKPQLDNVLNEVKRSLIDECDYTLELQNMNSIREDLNSYFNGIYIPKAYPEYSTKHIITTECVEGDSFEESQNYSQSQRDELGTMLYESFLFSLFEKRHLHTDPQNGNYMFQPQKIFIFDFGSTKQFTEEFVQDYAVLQYAVEIDNSNLYRQVGKNLGLILDEDSEEFVLGHMNLVKQIYGPFMKEGTYFAQGANPFGVVKEFISNMEYNGRPSPNQDFVLLDRANVGIFSKLQAWKSRVNWREGMKKFRAKALEKGLDRYQIKG